MIETESSRSIDWDRELLKIRYCMVALVMILLIGISRIWTNSERESTRLLGYCPIKYSTIERSDYRLDEKSVLTAESAG